MRKIVLLLSCILMFSSVFSQVKTKEYFIAKSKKQKAVAWTLLGTGAAAIISGAIIDKF